MTAVILFYLIVVVVVVAAAGRGRQGRREEAMDPGPREPAVPPAAVQAVQGAVPTRGPEHGRVRGQEGAQAERVS